jgi:hypothetical protein
MTFFRQYGVSGAYASEANDSQVSDLHLAVAERAYVTIIRNTGRSFFGDIGIDLFFVLDQNGRLVRYTTKEFCKCL